MEFYRVKKGVDAREPSVKFDRDGVPKRGTKERFAAIESYRMQAEVGEITQWVENGPRLLRNQQTFVSLMIEAQIVEDFDSDE